MKVIKIDVQKELLDVEPKRSYTFYKSGDVGPWRLAEDNPISGDDTVVEYRVMKMYNPFSEEPITNYLVKSEDRQIVHDLLTIEKDVVEGIINKKVNNRIEGAVYIARMDERMSATYREHDRIENLSWWKRLFNKF